MRTFMIATALYWIPFFITLLLVLLVTFDRFHPDLQGMWRFLVDFTARFCVVYSVMFLVFGILCVFALGGLDG